MCLWHLGSHRGLSWAPSYFSSSSMSSHLKWNNIEHQTLRKRHPHIPEHQEHRRCRETADWPLHTREMEPRVADEISPIQMQHLNYTLLDQDPPSSEITCYTTPHSKQLTLRNTLGSPSPPTYGSTIILTTSKRTPAAWNLHFLNRNLRISSTEVKTQAY